jgi:hypothetical protein
MSNFLAGDEDILRFSPTSLGDVTAGSWAFYFDGSDVNIGDGTEDIDAMAVHPSGKIYFSTRDSFSVPGLNGADEDVGVFVPTTLGNVTAGSYEPALFFDGSAQGVAANDVFAIDLP